MYKVSIENRQYAEWSFYNVEDYKKIEFPFKPHEHKMFHHDTFDVDDQGNVKQVHSCVRRESSLPGVLMLEGDKTYGRNSKGKLLYKCIPNDIHLPPFLIPYERKTMGFSKSFDNLYVTFSFTGWTEKHPYGVLNQTIGPVNVLQNFYEYQLYCKSLHASIQTFTKKTSKALEKKPHDAFIENICKTYPQLEDRTDDYVFTIDPPSSLDFDDAFSIRQDTADAQIIVVSIYISNVTMWMDILDLWDSFSTRVATIYLPDRKRPMLPAMLSDCLCSLQEKCTRIALTMDITFHNNEMVDVRYSNAKIRVKHNYTYEEQSLLKDPHYQILLQLTKQLSKKIKFIPSVQNSHDVVAYLMIMMNYQTACSLWKHKNGIFRSTIIKKSVQVPNALPEDVATFLKIWNNGYGQYIDGSVLPDEGDDKRHSLLDLEAYVHITSPIRRLVDLLNMIQLQKNLGLVTLGSHADEFYKRWIVKIDYINTTMRSIRRVQTDCHLLDLCVNHPETMDKLYEGYMFDKMDRNDGVFVYVVYLPALKLVSRVTYREHVENYETRQFRLYLFHDEERFKKKIRMQVVGG